MHISYSLAAFSEYEDNISRLIESAEYIFQECERQSEIIFMYNERVKYIRSQLVHLKGSESEHTILEENLSLLENAAYVFSRYVEDARTTSLGLLGLQVDALRTEVESLSKSFPSSAVPAALLCIRTCDYLDALCTKILDTSAEKTSKKVMGI